MTETTHEVTNAYANPAQNACVICKKDNYDEGAINVVLHLDEQVAAREVCEICAKHIVDAYGVILSIRNNPTEPLA